MDQQEEKATDTPKTPVKADGWAETPFAGTIFERIGRKWGYRQAGTMLLQLGAWVFWIFSLMVLTNAFQVGAVHCVQFRPIIDQTISCLENNNSSNPDVAFVPQLECEVIINQDQFDGGYNYSGYKVVDNLTVG